MKSSNPRQAKFSTHASVAFMYALAILVFLGGAVSPVLAQEFFLMSERLDLYCVYGPSETLLGTYNSKKGNVSYSDFDSQIQRVTKLAKKIQARISTLQRMKRDGTVTLQEKVSFKKIYKQIHEGRYRSDNEIRIASLNRLINSAEGLLNEFFALLDSIEDCKNRNLQLAAAQGLSVETLVIPFINPVYKFQQWLVGVALVSHLNKQAVKKGGGLLCVGNKSSPSYYARTFEANLCSTTIDFGAGGLFPIQYYFVCPATSAGLEANAGVSWIDWGIYSAPPRDSDIAEWDRLRDRTFDKGYRSKAYSKKRKCS